MSDTTIEPPLLAPSSVSRPALMARLDAASKLRLVVMAAPAGSGKTTLLTQWFRRSRQRRAAAWLTLDPAPQGPAALAARLLASLSAAVPDLQPHATHPPDGERLVPTLQALLAQRSGDLLIVIDDMHRAQDAPCMALLDALLAASAPGVHWVLAGRCLPALNLPAWRLRDQLEMVDGGDLAFDAGQVMQLGRKLMDEPLSRAQAERLLEATQGWTAGVKLGLLAVSTSAAHPQQIDAALADFDGGHVDMAAYLEHEVLQEQSTPLQNFLLSTSLVDTMTGELCDALLGRDGSQGVLEKLERKQLFVTAQDSHGLAFRYHPLFHAFLRSRLAAEPARQRALHERASRWYAAQLRFAEALAHAFKSGEVGWCAELVERAALRWQQSGDIAEVVHWCERLPHEQLLARPALGVTYTTCLVLCRRFDQAHAMLRRLAENGTASGFHLRTLQQILQALSGEHEALADEPPAADQTDGDAQLRGLHLVNRAYAMFCAHRFDPAWRLAMRAREILQPISPYGDGYASSVLALVERAKGDFGSAARRVEQLWAGVRNAPRNAAWANAATALAVLRYETNRLAEARALCEELLPLVEAGGTYETLVAATRTLSRVRAAEREPEAAMRLLDYLHGILEGSLERRFAAQVCFDKVRLWLAMGEPVRARDCAAEFGVGDDSAEWQATRPYDEAWERRGMTRAALLSHAQRHEESRAILQVLRGSAEAAGHVLRLHAVEAALASTLWEAGARDEALQCLLQSLLRARGHAPSRSWFDDNPRFHQVLIAALQMPQMRRLMPEHVLRVFGAALGRTDSPQKSGKQAVGGRPAHAVDTLTARELEVLGLMAQGLTNQQISARAQISMTTVKWHVKNIFAKLGVGTRVGALVRARELRLVEWGERKGAGHGGR